MKARSYVNKAKRLEKKLHDLQGLIYDFSSELEDNGLAALSELASESGLELDTAHIKMKEIWQQIESAFCKKITPKTNTP